MTMVNDGPLVLGIETSCDETGVGIVRGRELLADEVASSMDQHARFGGVVPEVASRAHLEAMIPVLMGAIAKAGVRPSDLDAVAVTAGPGLAGALMVGVAAAKAYAYALGKPLYGVNHLAAHVAVDQLEHGPLPAPCVALLVSGGHRDRVHPGQLLARRGQRPVHRGNHRLQVSSAGHLGHHPAEAGVFVHAGGHRVGQQLVPADQPRTGLVARRLDAQDQRPAHCRSSLAAGAISCSPGSTERRITMASMPLGW